MPVKVELHNNQLIAFIEGDIDHHTAQDIRKNIDNYVEKYNPEFLVLDFKSVQFMDTSGIGLIMGRFKLMSALKGTLKVINIPNNLKRMVKLSGLGGLGIFEREGQKNERCNKRNEYKFF